MHSGDAQAATKVQLLGPRRGKQKEESMSLDIELLDNYCEHCQRGDVVFSANITHNLGEMAEAAGIYRAMWRPEEIGAKWARDVTQILLDGLELLRESPNRFRKMNPSNGWGSYEGLVRFTEGYLAACLEHPDTLIKASR